VPHRAEPISSRTRRAVQTKSNPSNPSNEYEAPNEEEELLGEVLASAHKAAKKLDNQPVAPRHAHSHTEPTAVYLTPSPSANRNSAFNQNNYATPSKPMDISKPHPVQPESVGKWPTPPDDSDWASSVAASLMATQSLYR
jgi:meiosis induction protein kinase IME2/SME1